MACLVLSKGGHVGCSGKDMQLQLPSMTLLCNGAWA